MVAADHFDVIVVREDHRLRGRERGRGGRAGRRGRPGPDGGGRRPLPPGRDRPGRAGRRPALHGAGQPRRPRRALRRPPRRRCSRELEQLTSSAQAGAHEGTRPGDPDLDPAGAAGRRRGLAGRRRPPASAERGRQPGGAHLRQTSGSRSSLSSPVGALHLHAPAARVERQGGGVALEHPEPEAAGLQGLRVREQRRPRCRGPARRGRRTGGPASRPSPLRSRPPARCRSATVTAPDGTSTPRTQARVSSSVCGRASHGIAVRRAVRWMSATRSASPARAARSVATGAAAGAGTPLTAARGRSGAARRGRRRRRRRRRGPAAPRPARRRPAPAHRRRSRTSARKAATAALPGRCRARSSSSAAASAELAEVAQAGRLLDQRAVPVRLAQAEREGLVVAADRLAPPAPPRRARWPARRSAGRRAGPPPTRSRACCTAHRRVGLGPEGGDVVLGLVLAPGGDRPCGGWWPRSPRCRRARSARRAAGPGRRGTSPPARRRHRRWPPCACSPSSSLG